MLLSSCVSAQVTQGRKTYAKGATHVGFCAIKALLRPLLPMSDSKHCFHSHIWASHIAGGPQAHASLELLCVLGLSVPRAQLKLLVLVAGAGGRGTAASHWPAQLQVPREPAGVGAAAGAVCNNRWRLQSQVRLPVLILPGYHAHMLQ